MAERGVMQIFTTKAKRYSKKMVKVLRADIANKLKYGFKAPLYAERIWVRPKECKRVLLKADEKGFRGMYSGMVVHSWPPITGCINLKLLEYPKIKSCVDHWKYGIPWEDTEVYKYSEKRMLSSENGIYNNCKSIEDLIERYRQLDYIYQQVKRENRIKAVKEFNPKAFREEDGILIHIGPFGELYIGGSFHRFAMALVLNLKIVPAQIGCIHSDALIYLSKLRSKSIKTR